MNTELVIGAAQQLAEAMPAIIKAYKTIAAEVKDHTTLPTVEELTAQADAVYDKVDATADAEIEKYKAK